MDQKEQILSTINEMVDAFHQGDIAGILRTYEAGAVVMAEPGAPVSGRSALEAMFAGFIAAGARFTFLGHEVIQAGDLAIHFTPWRMTGTGPGGSPITGGGLSVAVLRRVVELQRTALPLRSLSGLAELAPVPPGPPASIQSVPRRGPLG